MDSKPFSAPASSTDSKPETSGVTEIKPPATVIVNSTPNNEYQTPQNSILNSTNPAVQTINVSQPGGGGKTVSNVFLIIGAVVIIIGFLFIGLGAASFPDFSEVKDAKVDLVNPLLEDTIVFTSDGETTNETFEFSTDVWYNVRAAQGITINSISILDENNNTLFSESECQDSNLGDEVNDCKDYASYDIGNLDWARQQSTSGLVNATININATGEVTIHNLDWDEFWVPLGVALEDIDAQYYGGPIVMIMVGGCASCCVAPIGFLVGLVTRFA
ncbi:MAG: hypothetical protein CL983_05635 [Euryarchaeota archaeon]|nr:hypothetical protein [Euryarchaeota archaeon]